MTKELCDALCEALAQEGETDFSRQDDYSGRGMFGERTCALVVPRLTDLLSAAVFVGMAAPEKAADLAAEVRGLRTDDMGRDIVVY